MKKNPAQQIVITLLAIALFFPIFNGLEKQKPRRLWRGYGRMGDLKQIGLGLLMYSGEHQGHFPEDLWALYDEEILSARMLASPAEVEGEPGDQRGIFDRYHYLGAGLKDDAAEASITRLVVYPYRSEEQMHVSALYVDGHVEGSYN